MVMGMRLEGVAAGGQCFLALGQDGGLPRYVGQSPDDLLVPVDKSVQSVGDAHLVAELLH